MPPFTLTLAFALGGLTLTFGALTFTRAEAPAEACPPAADLGAGPVVADLGGAPGAGLDPDAGAAAHRAAVVAHVDSGRRGRRP